MSPWYGPATVARALGENKYLIIDDSLESALIPEEEIPMPAITEPTSQEMDVEGPSAKHKRSATMKILQIQEPARNPDSRTTPTIMATRQQDHSQ
jgi:hypothetical protein